MNFKHHSMNLKKHLFSKPFSLLKMSSALFLAMSLMACQGHDNKSAEEAETHTKPSLQSSTIDTTIPPHSDTAFILRELSRDVYHAIYIEKNRNSRFYKNLLDFNFSKSDQESMLMNYNNNSLVEEGKHLRKYDLQGLPKEWVPVYNYKDHLYLYAPSDWGNAGRVILSDTALIFWYMDGPYPVQYMSFKKTNANDYKLEYAETSGQSSNRTVIIHTIDPKTGLTLWEYTSGSGGETFYQLNVPKEKASNFDMIVNYCEHMKQMEFDFDPIDYKKYLNKK